MTAEQVLEGARDAGEELTPPMADNLAFARHEWGLSEGRC